MSMTAAAVAADDDLDIPQLYQFALTLANEAGQLLLAAIEKRRAAHNGSLLPTATKMSSVDIVTETDEGASPPPDSRVPL